MSYTTLLISRSDKVGTITFNRPDKMNAFTAVSFKEFIEALRELDADDSVNVIVITGAGKAFSAGLDLEEAKKGPAKADLDPVPAEGTLPWIGHTIRAMKKPTIAAINGVAVGAGFTIPLACDIRIASDTAKLGAGFLRIGLIPEIGSSYNLPRLVGIAKACELVFTAKTIDAREAKEVGLVNEIVPAEELMAFVTKMAVEIAGMPQIALQLAKKALYQGMDSDLDSQIQFEQMCQSICFKTEDHMEGMKAVVEKRKPVFKGK